jgi:hypothetical protein
MSNIFPPIAMCAVGAEHISEAITLLEQLQFLKTNYVIITDQPDAFDDFNSIAIEYEDAKFSFHAKRQALHLALELSKDGAILMDVDMMLRGRSASLIDFESLANGIHPQLIWKHPADCSFENFIEGKVDRVPYGKEFKVYCDQQQYRTDGAILVQESMLFMKGPASKTRNFFKIWDDLADFCNSHDEKREQAVLGYGEGYSIGAAALNAGIKIHDPGTTAFCEFYKDFKHLIWEK